MLIKLGEKRRIYIAETISKIVEFVVSILIIGYLVAAKIDPKVKLDLFYLTMAVFLAIIFMYIGVLITPEKED